MVGLTPITDRTECRYCNKSFETPDQRLEHEVDCGFSIMQ